MEFLSFEELSGKYLNLLDDHSEAVTQKTELESSIQAKKSSYEGGVDVIGDRPFLEEIDQLAIHLKTICNIKEELKAIEGALVERLQLLAPLYLTQTTRRRGKRICYKFEIEAGNLKVTMNLPVINSQVISI